MSNPRPEYPRPQFVRDEWLNLNGEWQFEIDSGDSGKERGLVNHELAQTITVPFCPESPLSGIGNTDFLNAVWYRRVVTIPEEWAGKRVLLHFGAVDYDATVWADSIEVGRHRGGFSPFTCDLGEIAHAGQPVTIVVRARDVNGVSQPRGKQSDKYAPYACWYTRTTGIWQTVWMEPVPESALRRPRITPDVANSMFRLEQPLSGSRPGLRLRARLRDSAGVVCEAECAADMDLAPRLDLAVPSARRRLWSPEDPFLYDLEIVLLDADGSIIDRAASYAGLRCVTLVGKEVRLNGKVVFQRLVLDQGYYPDGVLTAPTDDALVHDIKISMEAGFNGARLHQKVFEERFLYHADRLGYLVWGEFADWGAGSFGTAREPQMHGVSYAAQWLEVVERDYSHPAIIGWCPLNETYQALSDRITTLDDVTRALFLATKAMDTSRPVLDTSGYSHRVRESDIYDSHDYIMEQDFEKGINRFKKRHEELAHNKAFVNPHPEELADGTVNPVRTIISVPYGGQPYFVSEFGGFKWNPDAPVKSAVENMTENKTSWGYGSDPTSLDDFYARFAAVCDALRENAQMFGYCYTQLTDIYPEENGLYTFDRRPKFDMDTIRAIQERPAAIEQTAGDQSKV